MIAADRPVQRPPDAKLLVADAAGRITHASRARLLDFLRAGDLVIANDAATLPASIHGVHLPTGAGIEVRLAGRSSLAAMDVVRFTAVVFGAGDYRTRTEDRELPPALAPGDVLVLGPAPSREPRSTRRSATEITEYSKVGHGDHGAHGGPPTRSATEHTRVGHLAEPAVREASSAVEAALTATIESLLGHPRLVLLRFRGSSKEVWAGLACHGRPIQYAHMPAPLALWDVWTPIAGLPVAFEPPSASFALDWGTIGAMRRRGIGFETITLAAGISSTGDPELDRRLPFDEPYRIPEATASAIQRTKARGGRIIAVGTTVVRALEHAAAAHSGAVQPVSGMADQRMGPDSRLRVVDAMLSGTHEPDSSHYQLLRAFLADATLARTHASLEAQRYRTHEFGDSVLVEKQEQFRVPSSRFRVPCSVLG